MSILGFILFIVVAAACAWTADFLVPGTIPGGFFVAAICGVLGAWIGSSIIGYVGPSLAGVPILPAILGSGLVIVLMTLIGKGLHKAAR